MSNKSGEDERRVKGGVRHFGTDRAGAILRNDNGHEVVVMLDCYNNYSVMVNGQTLIAGKA